MKVKAVSIEEANRLVPFLGHTLKRLSYLVHKLETLDNDIKHLEHLWGSSVLSLGHTDNEYYRGLKAKKAQTERAARQELNRLKETGGVIRSFEPGHIDFYFSYGNHVIFLCWRMGEEKIEFWHGVSESFMNRRPLSELIIRERSR